MLDTMTFTKTLGAVCGSLLVFLLGGWAAESLYHGGGHGDGEQAYVIDTGEADMVEAEPAPEVPFAEVFAAVDPADGEPLWNQCRACHQLEDGANGVGPHLYAVVGRGKGDVDGYAYSDYFVDNDEVWTTANLNAFLENPRDYAPGTKMGYAGMGDVADRAALIAYLATFGGTIEEGALATPAAATETADAAQEAPATDEAAAEVSETAEAAETADEPAQEAAEGDGAADSADAGTAGDDAAAVLPGADVAAGEAGFRVCRACHQIEEGRNTVGPHLFGILGREIASVEGYSYSPAFAELPGSWTVEELDAFLAAPRDYAPGTKMVFPGVADADARRDMIAYLATLGN